MDRRPRSSIGPDLRPARGGRNDSSAVPGGQATRMPGRGGGATGPDSRSGFGLPPGALADDIEESELDAAVPNAERLVAQAVTMAGDDHDTATLVARFWRFAPDEDLVGLTPEQMITAAREHQELAEQRVPGELKLRIHEPGPEQQHSVIEIVTDDMPFLVDSVTALLTSRHLDVHLLVHPLVVVRREPLGRLTEVAANVEPDDAIDGDIVESWMHVEIDPVRGEGARDELRRELQRVLTDVREAVEDWPRMRQQALELADELAAARTSDNRPPVPEKDITDSVELLRWLAHDHFTFLGYREYRLVDGDAVDGQRPGEQVLEAGARHRPGHPAPGRKPAARALSSMPAEAHDKALEKRLLIITKANSRATVHRSAYLDYIGFKIFNDSGEVIGERRFLGLFSTAAYRTSVRELPVVRRKVAEVLERSGLSAAQPLRQGPAADPGDLPARRALPDQDRRPLPRRRSTCCAWPGRRQLRALRAPRRVRPVRLLPDLPAAGPVHHREPAADAGHPAARAQRHRRRLHHPGHRVDAGAGALHRPHRPGRPARRGRTPTCWSRSSPTRPGTGTTTSAWCWNASSVTSRPSTSSPATPTPSPTRTRTGTRPYEAMKDLAKLELLEEPGQLEMHLFRKQYPPRRSGSPPSRTCGSRSTATASR